MPKGNRKKRTQEEYEKEIEDAVKRFKKYPEYLRSAIDSEEWQEFLLNIGLSPTAILSGNFWENVREKIIEEEVSFTERELQEARVKVEAKLYRDVKGRFTTEVTDKPIVSYRSTETGRFVSRKTIREG